MSDKEISELTAATTPLAGTELIHVDQGGNSRKVAVSEIAALVNGAMLKADYDPNDDDIISVANGGTNASTASGARTNLGLGTMAVQNAASVAITGGSVTGITDLAIADGGTGASDAAGARANLDLEPGVDVQAYLGAGTDGQVLKWQGANPVWGTVAGTGDMVGSNNLSELTNTTTALTNLGGGTAGKTIFAHGLQADVRGYLGVEPHVATRTAAKALDTTKDTVLYLTEKGFERRYIWRTGDYSAEIAADVVGEKYLKADAIASTVGAWVWEHVDRDEWHPLQGSPTIIRDSERGHSWAIGGFHDVANARTIILQARGPKHSVSNGGGLFRGISRDSGLNLKEEQTLLQDILWDSRYASCGVIGATAQVFVKQITEASVLDHKVLQSTDYFYSNVTETDFAMTFGHHPHGNVMTFPASLGGSDTQGAIVYTYGANNIRSVRTTDNWATKTENGSMITPPVGITTLSEPFVVECGAPNKRWMVIRVDSPSGNNYLGSYSTDGITWAAAYDSGLYGGSTPTYARYEARTNRVYLYRVNRVNTASDFDPNFPASALLWTWEDADHLMAGGAVRRDWSVSAILPDFPTGYLTEIEIDGRTVVFGTCAESVLEGPTLDWTTSRRSTTKHFILGQIPLTNGVRPRINRNELRNPQFRVWQNGTSFDASVLTESATPTADGAMTADEVFVAVSAGVTGTVSRTDLSAAYERMIPGGPNHAMRINLSAGNDPTDEQRIIVRKRDVSRWADSVATWTLWIKGTPPSTLKFRARISYDGTSYSESSASSVVLTPLRTTEDITVLSASVEIPSVVGDVITSAGFITFELRTTNEATDYEICSWKLEEGADRTDILPMPYNESYVLCQQERKVWSGFPFFAIASGGAFSTTGARIILPFGDMASTPTVTFSGAGSDYGLTGGSNVVCNALPTAADITTKSCEITAAVAAGLTTGQFYALRGETSTAKIVVATGF